MDALSRRQFLQAGLALGSLGLLAGCGIILPPAQSASGGARVRRIGYLTIGRPSTVPPPPGPFQEGLRELGWVDGQNLAFEYRFADREDALPGLAAELVALPVDVIFTGSTAAAIAAKQATGTIPIVMGTSSDADKTGLVASLAHPGGNVTGMTGPLRPSRPWPRGEPRRSTSCPAPCSPPTPPASRSSH